MTNSFSARLKAKQHVGLPAQILSIVEYGTAFDLICGEVEISVGGERERIGPEHSRVVNQRLDLTGFGSTPHGIMLVVAEIDAPFGVRFESVAGAEVKRDYVRVRIPLIREPRKKSFKGSGAAASLRDNPVPAYHRHSASD